MPEPKHPSWMYPELVPPFRTYQRRYLKYPNTPSAVPRQRGGIKDGEDKPPTKGDEGREGEAREEDDEEEIRGISGTRAGRSLNETQLRCKLSLRARPAFSVVPSRPWNVRWTSKVYQLVPT